MHRTVFEPGGLTGGKNICKIATVYFSQVTTCPVLEILSETVTQAQTLICQLSFYFVNNTCNLQATVFPNLHYVI